jgi:hypothetical protein
MTLHCDYNLERKQGNWGLVVEALHNNFSHEESVELCL